MSLDNIESFLQNENGATVVEYALLLGILSLFIISAAGIGIDDLIGDVSTAVEAV